MLMIYFMAEKRGFEPPEPLLVHALSRGAHSTTLPLLRVGASSREIVEILKLGAT